VTLISLSDRMRRCLNNTVRLRAINETNPVASVDLMVSDVAIPCVCLPLEAAFVIQDCAFIRLCVRAAGGPRIGSVEPRWHRHGCLIQQLHLCKRHSGADRLSIAVPGLVGLALSRTFACWSLKLNGCVVMTMADL
jgi:hypothetical protein